MPKDAQKTETAKKFVPPKAIPLDETNKLRIENAVLKTELAKARVGHAQRDLFDAGNAQLEATYQVIVREVPVVLEMENPQSIAEQYRYNEQTGMLILIDSINPPQR